MADTILETEKFDVNFTQGTWTYTSPMECATQGKASPIGQEDYPLRFQNDRNWLLDFPLGDGRNLLVPCLEFLVRFYGRSEEVPRVLVTYPWPEVERRYYAPFDQPTQPNAWPIKLTKRLRNGDVVFLAHAKYDPYTQRVAKGIYSQVEVSFHNHEPYAFLKIAPWFQGPAEIRVSGWWINGGRTFLGLRIKGGSDPQGEAIQRDRENPNKADKPAEGGGEGKAWNGAPEKILKRLPEIVDLTDTDEPDHGAPTLEVEEEEFEPLGIPRVVTDVRRNQAKTSSGKPRRTDEPETFSTGDPYGNEKGVGKAAIHARPILESHGKLRDMWDAIQYLRKAHSKRITAAEFFTFENGFQNGEGLHLIGLEPFDENVEDILVETRRWPIFDAATEPPTPRGILVAKIVADGNIIYIIEIQRKPKRKKEEDGSFKDTEENFRGLVCQLNDEHGFDAWLKQLLSDIRYVRGVVKRLVGKCPGKADVFNHSASSDERVACESVVLNALKKMGIAI